jgi:hypothetical protein
MYEFCHVKAKFDCRFMLNLPENDGADLAKSFGRRLESDDLFRNLHPERNKMDLLMALTLPVLSVRFL